MNPFAGLNSPNKLSLGPLPPHSSIGEPAAVVPAADQVLNPPPSLVEKPILEPANPSANRGAFEPLNPAVGRLPYTSEDTAANRPAFEPLVRTASKTAYEALPPPASQTVDSSLRLPTLNNNQQMKLLEPLEESPEKQNLAQWPNIIALQAQNRFPRPVVDEPVSNFETDAEDEVDEVLEAGADMSHQVGILDPVMGSNLRANRQFGGNEDLRQYIQAKERLVDLGTEDKDDALPELVGKPDERILILYIGPNCSEDFFWCW
jgi:hypothetical protein